MLDVPVNLLIRPLVFLVAALPLVIHNLHTGEITNRDNAILFSLGLGLLVFGQAIGLEIVQSSPWWFWVGVGVLLLSGRRRWDIGGGAVKFLMALLPWFPQKEYLFAALGGFLVKSVVGEVKPFDKVQIAPIAVALGLIGYLVAISQILLHGPSDQVVTHTRTLSGQALQ